MWHEQRPGGEKPDLGNHASESSAIGAAARRAGDAQSSTVEKAVATAATSGETTSERQRKTRCEPRGGSRIRPENGTLQKLECEPRGGSLPRKSSRVTATDGCEDALRERSEADEMIS